MRVVQDGCEACGRSESRNPDWICVGDHQFRAEIEDLSAKIPPQWGRPIVLVQVGSNPLRQLGLCSRSQ